MKETRRDDIPYFLFESLPGNGQLKHAVFTRQGGVSQAPFDSLNLSVSVPDSRDDVYANRQRAYGVYGRDAGDLVHAHLVHGAEVARVSQSDNGTWARQVDGLISDEPGCGLAMNFADCAGIFLYDPVKQAIGLGHAGWQGAVKDLPRALVRAMAAAFGSDPATLVAAIGPCIGPCCYEVGEPVISAVHDAFAEPDSLLIAQPGDSQPHFDLPAANRRRLERAGVHHIEWAGLCTACHTDLFYSHRAEQGRTGRFGAVMILGY